MQVLEAHVSLNVSNVEHSVAFYEEAAKSDSERAP